MIVTILQRLPYSPVVVPTLVIAASSRLGPALGTVLARRITKKCATSTPCHKPDANDDHSFDVFDGVTKHFDALEKKKNNNPLEKSTGKMIDTSSFLTNDPFDENETSTKAARLYEAVHKVTKKSKVDRHIEAKSVTKSASDDDATIVDTQELLVVDPFDENEAYEKAVRAAEHAKHVQPPKEKFDKQAYAVENPLDVNETVTKLSRAQERVQV